jgi:hypothetical protein
MILNNMNNGLIPHDDPFFKDRTHADAMRKNTITGRHLASDACDLTANDIPKHVAGIQMRHTRRGDQLKMGGE